MILAGDIGGTSTRLALVDGDPRDPVALEVYRSREHAGLEEMVREFLAAHPAEVRRACFGVAGPVRGGRCVDTTNLAWPVEGASLAREIGRRVSLLNDLEANAWGLAALGPDDFAVLNGRPGRGRERRRRLRRHRPRRGRPLLGRRASPSFATEGGQADFAPRSELEEGLRRYLAWEYGHVSYDERVCSGLGLVNVYRYLVDTSGEQAAVELDGGAIARAALEGSNATCSRALDLMISIYGAQAGNVALTLMATGGVYLGGGIPPRILPRLREGGFMRAFVDKGRFRPLLERVPVRVILNDGTALMGAALCASA